MTAKRMSKSKRNKENMRRCATKKVGRPAVTDVVLPMNQPSMQHIVDGSKSHEFRIYLIPCAVKRVWFYVTAPESAITHICKIDPAWIRDDGPLPITGIGNKEFN
jgi:hypothetical protein